MRTLKDGQLRVVFWNEVKPDEDNGGAPVEKGDDLRERASQLMWMIDLSRWPRIPRFVAFSQSPKRCRSPQATCIWYDFRFSCSAVRNVLWAVFIVVPLLILHSPQRVCKSRLPRHLPPRRQRRRRRASVRRLVSGRCVSRTRI